MKIKCTLLTVLLIPFAIDCSADVLIYNYSGTEKVIQPGQEFSFGYSGQMFYDSGATNGVFVGWVNHVGRKAYWVNPLTNHIVATINGKGTDSYTVLAQVGQTNDASGNPDIWSFMFKGKNEQLNTGTNRFVTFPTTFNDSETDVHFSSQSSAMISASSTIVYVFQPTSTQNCNDNGLTINGLVAALTNSLQAKGYQEQ